MRRVRRNLKSLQKEIKRAQSLEVGVGETYRKRSDSIWRNKSLKLQKLSQRLTPKF